MEGERQPLHVIVEIIAQPQGDPFRRLRRPDAAQIGKRPFQDGQPHNGEREPGQVLQVTAFAHYRVNHVLYHTVVVDAHKRPQHNGEHCAEIQQAEAGQHAPQPHQAVFVHRGFQIKGQFS